MASKTIKIFHLANNKLNDIRDVAALKDFKGLSVLKVDGNPFVNKYVDEGHLERWDKRHSKWHVLHSHHFFVRAVQLFSIGKNILWKYFWWINARNSCVILKSPFNQQSFQNILTFSLEMYQNVRIQIHQTLDWLDAEESVMINIRCEIFEYQLF